MEIGRTLYAKHRRQWRAWLARHHKTAPEIWLIYYKKHSGKPRIPYNDAVEEALCYGWIAPPRQWMGTAGRRDTKQQRDWEMPKDILRRLMRDPATWKNFQRFPQSYKRIRVGWIAAARRRPDVFKQRLAYFLKMTAQNRRFGMVQ